MLPRNGTLALCALVFAVSPAAEEHFVWSATCTVACNLVGLVDGDAVDGTLTISDAAPLAAISAADITDFEFTLGTLVLSPTTHAIADSVDANVDADGSTIEMRLLEVQPLEPGETQHIQQPGGTWNAFPVGGVAFLLGVDGSYERQILSDTDGDEVPDPADNCTLIANPDQRDSNGDGFGNACDPDLDDNGVVNSVDLGLLRLAFFGTDDDADFNGDGVVNALDLGVMRSFFFAAPGPSGIVGD